MSGRETKISREPSHSPNFIKIGLIILLTIVAVILIAKFVVGLKLDFLGF